MNISAKTALIVGCLCIVALQFYSRFFVAIDVDFTMDDWALLARSSTNYETLSDALEMTRHDPDRPFGAGALSALFNQLNRFLT